MKLRRLAPLALVILLSLVLCGGASTTAVAASKPAPKNKQRHLDATFSTDIEAPPGLAIPTLGAMTMWVPKGVTSAGDTMRSCSLALISAQGIRACPLRSFVGKGTASGLIAFISQTAVEPMTITLVNGPGNTLIAHVRGTNPVSIDVGMQSIIKRPAGKYGMQLYFPFPDELIHPVPGSTASLQHLTARLDGKVGWLRSTSCPPRGWSLGAMLTSVDGSFTSITADLSCV